jgi:hypothetical protein
LSQVSPGFGWVVMLWSSFATRLREFEEEAALV